MTKVHKLNANSMEISIKEETELLEIGDELHLKTNFKKTVRDIPNKRAKKNK